MSSQLTFIETGWFNHVRPFQYALEGLANYGVPPASLSMIACPLFFEVNQTYERLKHQYFGDNSYTYYKPLDLGRRNKWTAKFAPFDSTYLKLQTKLPNYAAATDNLAASIVYLRSWNQSVGAYTLSEHFESMNGSRAESVKQSVNAEGIVETDVGTTSRHITKPNTTNPLTTPTMVAFGSITQTPWTNIDNGSLPLSVNSITYPTDAFEINIQNSQNYKAYNGSPTVDTNKVTKQKITGSFVGVVGKDLNLEGFWDAVALSSIPLSYAIKPATFTWTLAEIDMSVMEKTQSAESDDEWKLNISWDAKAQTISP